jgi:hypothetical protein
VTDSTAVAQALVRSYCGWTIAPSETIDLVVDGTPATSVLLPTMYLTAVNALSVDGQVVDVTPGVELQWSAAGVLRRCAGFGYTLRGVKVNVTHAYDDWPADVQAVIDGIVERVDNGAGVLVQVGNVRYATSSDGLPWAAQLSSSEQAVLSRYALPSRP